MYSGQDEEENKLVPNIQDKKTCAVHINYLDQALKHGLRLKNVHRVIRFQKAIERRLLLC